MVIRRFNCIWLFTLATFLFFVHAQQLECLHPTNYSDFSLVLIDNTIIATGANTVVRFLVRNLK